VLDIGIHNDTRVTCNMLSMLACTGAEHESTYYRCECPECKKPKMPAAAVYQYELTDVLNPTEVG
jgi:hypothetical protein